VSLRDLIRDEPGSVEDLAGWYERANIVRSIMELDCGDLAVPIALWRYRDDADVRLADRAYAEAELLHIKQVLQAWEAATLTPQPTTLQLS